MKGWKRALTVCLTVGFVVAGAAVAAAETRQGEADPTVDDSNAPWYPSLQAFEHYDSGRRTCSRRRGSAARSTGRTSVEAAESAATARTRRATTCPTSNENAAFIQGGSYGDVENSIGPFVAKVDPKTLKPVWYTQLVEHRADRGMGLPRRHGDR